VLRELHAAGWVTAIAHATLVESGRYKALMRAVDLVCDVCMAALSERIGSRFHGGAGTRLWRLSKALD